MTNQQTHATLAPAMHRKPRINLSMLSLCAALQPYAPFVESTDWNQQRMTLSITYMQPCNLESDVAWQDVCALVRGLNQPSRIHHDTFTIDIKL